MNKVNEASPAANAATLSDLLYGGERERELRDKYKCTGSDNGGWCDGVAVGSRMRCSEFALCKDRTRICRIGIDKGLNYQC